MTIRTFLVAFPITFCAALLTAGCATWSEPDPDASDSDVCAEEARGASGYRGVPVRITARTQQRNNEKWMTYYRVYDECIRERVREADD